MEYMRKKVRDIYFQFCDSERVVVMDALTGDLKRFAKGNYTVGTFEEALAYISRGNIPGSIEEEMKRALIVKLNCVQGFKLDGS